MRLFREVPITHYPVLHAEGWNYLFMANQRFVRDYFASSEWGDAITAEIVGWCIEQFGTDPTWEYLEETAKFAFKDANSATAFKLRWS